MISDNAVKEALTLSKAINSTGKTLYLKKGSLVDELVKTTLDNLPTDTESEDYIDHLTQALNSENADTVKFEELMTNYVRDIAEKANYTVRHTVQVVAKEVLRLRDCFIELDGAGDEVYSTDFFDVHFVSAPELLNTPFMNEILDSVNDDQMGYKRTQMPHLESVLSKLPIQFKELFSTGIDYVDACIESWVDESEFFRELPGGEGVSLFDIIKESLKVSDGDISRRTSGDYRINSLEFALFNLLLFRRLTSLRGEDGEYIKDVTVPAHNNYRFWSFITKKRLINYRKAISAGRIVSPVGTEPGLIEVMTNQNVRKKRLTCYTESIRKLKDRKVDIVSLYGHILGGGDYFQLTIDELTTDHERLANIFQAKVSEVQYIRKAAIIGKTKWTLRKAYSVCFKESIKEGHEDGVFDSEDEHIKIDYIGEMDRESVSKKVGEYIDSLNSDRDISLLDACIDIVAGIRYESYPAADYLRRFKRGVEGFDFNENNLRIMISEFVGRFLLNNLEILDQ